MFHRILQAPPPPKKLSGSHNINVNTIHKWSRRSGRRALPRGNRFESEIANPFPVLVPIWDPVWLHFGSRSTSRDTGQRGSRGTVQRGAEKLPKIYSGLTYDVKCLWRPWGRCVLRSIRRECILVYLQGRGSQHKVTRGGGGSLGRGVTLGTRWLPVRIFAL